jgi:hypothetical protein
MLKIAEMRSASARASSPLTEVKNWMANQITTTSANLMVV